MEDFEVKLKKKWIEKKVVYIVFIVWLFCTMYLAYSYNIESSKIKIANSQIMHAIKEELNIPLTRDVTVYDVKNITLFEINNNEIIINGTRTDIYATLDIISLSGLERFSELKTIKISNSNPIWLDFEKNNSSINKLEIYENEVVQDLKGIENLSHLMELYISKTNLSSLEKIAMLKNLNVLYAPNNQIYDCYVIEENRYEYINLYNNPIHDHRGLRNQTSVNIWSEGEKIENEVISYCNWRDSRSRQIHVLINNLMLRSNHYSEDWAKSLGYAIPGYYYILDEWWDNERGANWYKIGNDMWICSNEGSWTELLEW